MLPRVERPIVEEFELGTKEIDEPQLMALLLLALYEQRVHDIEKSTR